MKKLTFNFLLLLAFSLVFVSCNSDDDDNNSSSNNYLQIDNGSKSSVSNVIINGFKAIDANEENYYTISLSSVSGTTSKTATLAIYFPYNQNIDGTYTITSTTRELDDWLTNYAEFNGSSLQNYNDLTEGTCTVKRNATNDFTINFSFKTESGKTISGEYSGIVTIEEIYNN